jgi:hypothetical protein
VSCDSLAEKLLKGSFVSSPKFISPQTGRCSEEAGKDRNHPPDSAPLLWLYKLPSFSHNEKWKWKSGSLLGKTLVNFRVPQATGPCLTVIYGPVTVQIGRVDQEGKVELSIHWNPQLIRNQWIVSML